jgi:MFS transporter, OFA family, oxalate/formate antiporter
LVSNNVIAQWFVRRRGMAMGVAGQSLSISLLLFPALANLLILDYGWRNAWSILGVLVLLIMLPASWLFYRERPELYGLEPDGRRRANEEYAAATGDLLSSASEEQWTLAEAIRTPIFWLFLAGLTTITMILSGMVFHQASIFAVRGLDRTTAVFAFQVSAVIAIAGNLSMGHLLDKISARLLLVILLVALIGAMVVVQVMNNPLAGFFYAALAGVTSGSFRVMDGTVWAKYFGRRHLGSIRGATMVGSVGGTALGAFPLGLSYDLTGDYRMALNLLLVLPLAVIIAACFVKRPSRRVAQ